MASSKLPLRRWLSRLHLWLGLSVGLLFGLVGVSGSVLVFHTPLLIWQHPHLGAHEARVDGAVLGRIMQRESADGLRALDLPKADIPVWQGYFKDGSRRYFAPEDGRLLLSRHHDNDVLLWLHDFHVNLLGGETGEQVLGVVGCISLALLLIGLYLWWPKRGRLLAQLKMHARPPVRRWLTWHRSAGTVSLPLVLLAVVTGLGMIYNEAYSKVLTTAFGGDALPKPAASIASNVAPDWPRILVLAQATLPDARLSRVSVPKPGQDEVNVRAQARAEWHPNGRSMVVTNRHGSAVHLHTDARKLALGHRIDNAIYPLHTGVVGGWLMRWLTFFAGLVPMGLFITGLLFWLCRRHRG